MSRMVGVDPEFALIAMPFFDHSVDKANPFEGAPDKAPKKKLLAELRAIAKVAAADVVASIIPIPYFEKRRTLLFFQHTDELVGRQLAVAPSSLRLHAKAIQASAVREDFAAYAKKLSLPNIAKVIETAAVLRPDAVRANKLAVQARATHPQP